MPLKADRERLSGAAQGTIDLWLDAGVPNAGRSFIMVGSASGTSPGLPLVGGLATLPLNPDDFMLLSFLGGNSPVFSGFQGVLDGAGHGQALLDTLGPLPASAVGLVMHFAFTLVDPYDFVSNAVLVEIAP